MCLSVTKCLPCSKGKLFAWFPDAVSVVFPGEFRTEILGEISSEIFRKFLVNFLVKFLVTFPVKLVG